MNHHPTVTMTALDGDEVEIDKKLAPLITELWAGGIDTVSCCQDGAEGYASMVPAYPHLATRAAVDAGYAYVDFFDAADAADFLTVVANNGPFGKFYRRMTRWYEPGGWRKSIAFFDGVYEPRRGETIVFESSIVQIKFPVTDIAEIVRRLRRHNRASATALRD
jgi:hypothetical protein